MTKAFVRVFVPLIKTLEALRFTDLIAEGLYQFFTTDQFVFTLLHMRDVLPLLADVSVELQSADADMVVLRESWMCCIRNCRD